MRFEANESDYRAIKWPPPGPYWCSGYLCGEVGAAIVIAFIPLDDSTPARDRCILAEKIILEFWPEAKTLGMHGVETSGKQWRDTITFSDRFACPSWWDEKDQKVIGPTYNSKN